MATRPLLNEAEDRTIDPSSGFGELSSGPIEVQRRNDRSSMLDRILRLSDLPIMLLNTGRATGQYGYLADDDSLQNGLVPSRTLKIVPDPSSTWRDTRALVAQWAALEHDWNGDDADPPSEAQIAAIRSFVSAGERRGLREPRPYIAPDGEIGFHWDGERKASVSFLPQNRFLAFCPRGDSEPVRITGPLDIAACSHEMFDAIALLS